MAPTPPERKVQISRTDDSFLDREFKSIRERFDEEMKKMEEDMNRFRLHMQETRQEQRRTGTTSPLLADNSLLSKSSTKSTSSSSTSYQKTTSRTGTPTGRPPSPGSQRPGSRQGVADMSSWMDDFDSPLITDSNSGDGSRTLKLKFDVTQYEPEEIIVKTVDNKLQVHARHEEKSESRSVFREYNREFLLPDGVNPELIKSTLSRDGVLTVEAPLPPRSIRDKARNIPIERPSPAAT